MMENFYIYILQVNIGLSVFYVTYKMLFARDTFLGVRRLFLMTMVALAFSYPVISLSSWLEVRYPIQSVMVNYAEMLNVAVAVVAPLEKSPALTWQNLVLFLWGIGSLFLFTRILLQFIVVCRMAFRGKKTICRGHRVIVLSGNIAPFSFWGWIFVNPDGHEEKELSEIMAHEETHVRQWHSLDIMLGEMLCLFFWFNPVVWLLRKEIRQNLEFLADKGVVSSGYNRRNYQYHLLRLSYQSTIVHIVNNFNVSLLKKRIIMMNKKRTSRIGLMKYALLIPVTGIMILSANAKILVKVAENKLIDWQTVGMSEIQDVDKTEFTVKGKVIDDQGKPLPGVSIIVPRTNIGTVSVGTISDANGEFKLRVTRPGYLCFSYVGRKTVSLEFDRENCDLQVKLKKDNLYLDKVVVAGYMEAEKEIKDDRETFVVVEEMPEFLHGNVLKYIAKYIRYPAIAMENGIEGTVHVSFVINYEGKVTDAKVIRGVNPSLDEEALRVINSMPDWKPGKQRGKTVDVQYTLPIEFVLVSGK